MISGGWARGRRRSAPAVRPVQAPSVPTPRGIVVPQGVRLDLVVRERFTVVRIVPRPTPPPSRLSVCPCGAPSRPLTPGVFASAVPRIAPHLDADGNLCVYRYNPVPVHLRGAS